MAAIRFKVWIETDEGPVVFGQGRRALLASIAEEGSLQGAAKKLNMSYRAAWGRLRTSEVRLGFNLVEHHQGRKMELTEKAKTLMKLFNRLESQLATVIDGATTEFAVVLDKE